MYEIIIRLSRAIASRPRLRILTYLAQHGETTPTELQRALHLPLNALSAHLRTLSSVGLIRGRHSAAWCYYEFESPYPKNTLSGDMSEWLKNVLRKTAKGQPDQPRETRSRSRAAFGSELHAVVFEAATAFTDLRRLQILEHLWSHQRASGEALGTQLKMSEYAVCRQTAKLRRRGMIAGRREGKRELLFQLTARPKSAVHGGMLAIVRTTLHKG